MTTHGTTLTSDAEIAAGSITYAATDAFGNGVSSSGITGTLSAASGFFSGSSTTTTCVIPGTCAYGTVPQYDQSGVYGSIGQIAATLSGTSPSFSVSGTTGFIQTSTFATTASFSQAGGAHEIGAGSSTSVHLLLGYAQQGVPVKIQICTSTGCNTTKSYSGTFSGSPAVSGLTNSTGVFASSLKVSTTLGATATMNATVTRPVDGSGNPQSFVSSNSPAVKTAPGTASKLQLYATFLNGQGTGNSGPSTIYATSGATLYVDAILTDAYGNIVTNTSPQQIQVNLTPSGVSGGGLLSATQIYIAALTFSTNDTGHGSFGPVAWTLPTTLGASTVSATAVVAGNAVTGSITVTTISPLPTISVNSPLPVSGVIYSPSPFVTFSGKANASLGYASSTSSCSSPYACIKTLGYKINTNPWLSSSIASGSKILWSVPVTLATGLSTIQFNATDNKGNTAVSSSYQVLVDSVAPTFTFAGTTTATGCEAVTVTSAAGDFNTASFTATYNGSPISSANIAWSGTQTLGSPSTLTANVCGLVAGTGTLSVTGSTFAPVSGSASETLTVTVVLADSITFNTGAATYGVIGAYKGVTISVTNSWGSSQTVVIFATLKSGTSIYVAEGTATIAAGQTNSVVCLDLQTVPAGTYSVTFAAVTTSNAAVSAPVPGVNLVAT